jgi:hypothetical protein
MSDHVDRCACAFCARMKARSQELAPWLAAHEPHLHRRGGERFTTKPLEHAPEGYPAKWLVCPCGAQLLTTTLPENVE